MGMGDGKSEAYCPSMVRKLKKIRKTKRTTELVSMMGKPNTIQSQNL